MEIEKRIKLLESKLCSCFDSNGLIDVVKLANSYGFTVLEDKDMFCLVNGMLSYDENNSYIILNEEIDENYKRYTTIYLLCMYLLYYNGENIYVARKIDLDEDYNASYMARLMLIPNRIYKSANALGFYDEKDLAKVFKVPTKVVAKRNDDFKIKKLF